MYELIIIGAGPAGISMAVEARQAGVSAEKILVLEKSAEHSWSIRKFYPEKKLVEANFKGLPAVCHGVMCIPDMSKSETLSYLDKAIADHQIEVRYHQNVSAISPKPDGFEVLAGQETLTAKVCVVAIGILGKPNKPDYRLPVSLRPRIHYDVTSEAFEGQKMLVVGGGDSASEYAQYLLQSGNEVTLAYRRERFDRMTNLNRESLRALEERGQVRLLRGTDIEAVTDQDGQPLVQFKGDVPAESFDHVLYALGGSTPNNFLTQVGIEFDGKEPRVTSGYETNIKGLYLVGDLTPSSGSIIIAFNTAHEAMRSICDGHLECKLPPPRGAE